MLKTACDINIFFIIISVRKYFLVLIVLNSDDFYIITVGYIILIRFKF